MDGVVEVEVADGVAEEQGGWGSWIREGMEGER